MAQVKLSDFSALGLSVKMKYPLLNLLRVTFFLK